MASLKVNQPKRLKLNGTNYVRIEKFRWVDKEVGISEGPFYSKKDVEEPGIVYMPDAGFLHTGAPLQFMHRIGF